MKKVLTLIFILVFMLTMFGCDTTETEDMQIEGEFISSYIRVDVDPETGVNYILYGGRGIVPRYNADGTLYVSEVE